MNVLLLGADGFLGRHLQIALETAGHTVRKGVQALRRRSQTDRTTWARMNRLAERWLPVARIQHPWPTERFDAITRGGSPVR